MGMHLQHYWDLVSDDELPSIPDICQTCWNLCWNMSVWGRKGEDEFSDIRYEGMTSQRELVTEVKGEQVMTQHWALLDTSAKSAGSRCGCPLCYLIWAVKKKTITKLHHKIQDSKDFTNLLQESWRTLWVEGCLELYFPCSSALVCS